MGYGDSYYKRKEDTYGYDPNVDYMKKMQEAAASGNYEQAAKYEQQRNEKIKSEGLSQYEQTDQYSLPVHVQQTRHNFHRSQSQRRHCQAPSPHQCRSAPAASPGPTAQLL